MKKPLKSFIEITYAYSSPSKATEIWHVKTTGGAVALGEIHWHPSWRGYSFFPAAQTIFEEWCLREIADFIEARNNEHREKIKERKRGNNKSARNPGSVSRS